MELFLTSLIAMMGIGIATLGLIGLFVLAVQHTEYQIACWQYGRKVSQQQAQAHTSSKRVIEIHIS